LSFSEKWVLDASALLAYLQSEPGSDKVEGALASGAFVSAVNWSEVLSKIADVGQDPFAISARLREQGLLGGSLTVLPFDEQQAMLAAQLRPATRTLGLSFADRACLALALETRAMVQTADKSWASLVLDVEITVIR
jgi:PIN domain nuclease of toxin-antitoxin system